MTGSLSLPAIGQGNVRFSPTGDQRPKPNHSASRDRVFESILVQNMFENIVAIPPRQECDYSGVAAKLPSVHGNHNDDSDDDLLATRPMTRNELRRVMKPRQSMMKPRQSVTGRSHSRRSLDELVATSVH